MRLSISHDDITLGDLVDFEEVTGSDLLDLLEPEVVLCKGEGACEHDHAHNAGRPVIDMSDPKHPPLTAPRQPSPKELVGLVYIFGRHADPTLTFEGAKQIKVTALEFASDEDPTEPAEGPEQQAEIPGIAG